MKKVLVIGAKGEQGFAIAKELVRAGYEVSGLVTSSEGKQKLATEGIEPVVGNLGDVRTLMDALSKADAISLTFPTIFDKKLLVQFTGNIIEAAKRSVLEKIVYNTSTWYPDKESYALVHQIKQAQEKLFVESQLPVVILRPHLYFENIVGPWSLPGITNDSVFSYPILAIQKIPWISHHDVARYTKKALELDTLQAGRFDIGTLMSGEEIALALAGLFDKPVQFQSITPSRFEEQLLPIFGPLSKDITNSYSYTQQYPLEQSDCAPLQITAKMFDMMPLTMIEWFNKYYAGQFKLMAR